MNLFVKFDKEWVFDKSVIFYKMFVAYSALKFEKSFYGKILTFFLLYFTLKSGFFNFMLKITVILISFIIQVIILRF